MLSVSLAISEISLNKLKIILVYSFGTSLQQ